jgi:phosphatidylserine/phosphatidylglycerophosphate/cardiolipin synthase-like enzyme
MEIGRQMGGMRKQDWRWLRLLLALCVVGVTLVGCAAIDTVSGSDSSGGGNHTGDCSGAGCGTVAPGTGASSGLSLFVEPDAGEAPIVHTIESAQSSVWLEVYLLTDNNVIHVLEDAANRGVDVRVLLELNPLGGATSAQETLQKLQTAGIKAEGSDTAYRYTHEKALIVDGATVLIMTANLTKSALGGSSAATNREYGVIDTNAQDVQEAADIFVADWQRSTTTLTDPNLVVSPINARVRLNGFIMNASETLLVEDEELYDIGSESALIAAAKRGVTVEVILPAPSSSTGSNADVSRLLAGGVYVRYDGALYMHAKMMVANNAQAFVGSENFSSTSLDRNRELGILITEKSVITTLSTTFQQDWSDSQAA